MRLCAAVARSLVVRDGVTGGDLIEFGHVKFRFVPPGENYTFTADELAAIQKIWQQVAEAYVGALLTYFGGDDSMVVARRAGE